MFSSTKSSEKQPPRSTSNCTSPESHREEKNGSDSAQNGIEKGVNSNRDHKAVPHAMTDTPRKNNTDATQTGSAKPHGNDGMTPKSKQEADSSSQVAPCAPEDPATNIAPPSLLGGKKTGTETSAKRADSTPKETTVSVKGPTVPPRSKEASDAIDGVIVKGSAPEDSGNDRDTQDRTNGPLVKASVLITAAQTGAATTQLKPVHPSSLASTVTKTPPNPKTVTFDMNKSLTKLDSRGVGPSLPLPVVSELTQKQPTPQTAVVVPTTPPNPSVTSIAHSTEATLIMKPATPVLEPSFDETIRRLRAPLVDTYAPYIAPNDTSLSSARERLRTALDETRILRAAFTDRVYEKYKVLLRPVPKSVDPIIERIKADPEGVSRKLQEEIRMVKQEKDIEKKEAQQLHAHAAASAAGDGTPLNPKVNTQETAEQLAWFGAGLNIVILPEEDIDGDIDLSAYTHRGPTDPETGHRVGGISAAAAAAAEGLLDRVRRGGAIRMERQRMRQLKLLSGEDTDKDADSSAYLSHLLSSGSVGRTDLGLTTPPATTTGKALKRSTGSSRGSSSYASPTSAGKTSRGRSQTSLSGSSLLSLNPQTEEFNPQGGPSTAATAALISRGVGVVTNSRTVQQRWRHPHPESHGGRRLALTAQSNKKLESGRGTIPGVPPMPMSAYLALALPPLPTAKDRKEKKPVEVLDVGKASKERAKSAIHCVLEQFDCNQTEKDDSVLPLPDRTTAAPPSDEPEPEEDKPSHDNVEEKPVTVSEASSEPTPRTEIRKRPVTEIGLLRGMQQVRELAATTGNITQGESGVEVQKHDADGGLSEKPPPIDPVLAFSVLNALGVVREVTRSPQQQYSDLLLDLFQGPSDKSTACKTAVSEQTTKSDAASKLNPGPKAVVRGLVSRKRRFSEAFSNTFFDGADSKQHRVEEAGKSATESSTDTDDSIPSSTKPQDETVEKDTPQDPKKELGCKSGAEHEAPSMDTSLVASIRGGGEAVLASLDVNVETCDKATDKKDACDDASLQVAVPSIRGGGKALPDSPDDTAESPRNEAGGDDDTAPSRGNRATSTAAQSNGDWGDQPNQSFSGLGSGLTALSRSRSSPASFSPQRNTASNGARLPGPIHGGSPVRSLSHGVAGSNERYGPSPAPLSHSSLHHQPASSIGRPMQHAELPEYYGGIHQSPQARGGFGPNPPEWSPLGAAAAGLLPTHSSLAALGLNSHRAAVVSLQVQERAASVLLAREQARAAAAHRHVAAVRGGASMSALSPQQAAALMGAPAGHANSSIYHQASRTYGHMGPPSVSSGRVMTSPTTSPLIGITTAAASAHSDSRTVRTSQGAKSTTPVKVSESRHQDDPESAQRGTEDEPTAQGTKSKSTKSSSKADNPGEGNPKSHDPSRSSPVDVASTEVPTLAVDPKSADTADHVADTVVASIAATTENSTPPETATMHDEKQEASVSALTTAMRCFMPTPPPTLSKDLAENVVASRIHIAAASVSKPEKGDDGRLLTSLIEYLLSVGSAVPIPKALVSNPLKERLNTPGFKGTGSSSSSTIPKEVVVATIMVWLWAEHKDSFQRAFAKSGRIDVDPECKWLIVTAVDTAVRALMLEIADSVARGGALAASLGGNRSKQSFGAPKNPPTGVENEGEKEQGLSAKLDIQVASIVSEALMTEICIDDDTDVMLPHFGELVKQLDKRRLASLQAKSRERALLAALISRRASMTEAFSHAYASSMVRAGEALGHDELFEAVQHEGSSTSTMIPYDIFSDETGAWEDPCREKAGFTPNLTGDDIFRRAHARAMIQKSLKKLQDRHNIKGGTPNAGPYADPPPASAGGGNSASPSNVKEGRSGPGSIQRTNSGLKRKGSFSVGADTPATVGSGSAAATSMALYRPNHYSAPLIWDCDHSENFPYGRHTAGTRKRSLSFGPSGFGPKAVPGSGKRRKTNSRTSRSMSVSLPSASPSSDDGAGNTSNIKRSTEEINWTEVADVFQPVSISRASTPTARRAVAHAPVTPGKTIIAPFCRKIENIPEEESNDEDSQEEDLSDAAVLARHRVVLDEMKKKLEKFMAARKLAKQRGARRSSSNVK